MSTIVRLVEEPSSDDKRRALQSGLHRYIVQQKDFMRIPGNPIAYWVSQKTVDRLAQLESVGEVASVRQGLLTTDNERFLRYWHEVGLERIGFEIYSRDDCIRSRLTWFPIVKGGNYRKWYGNFEHVVDWYADGKRINETVRRKYPYLKGNVGLVTKLTNPYFEVPFLTWTDITSGTLGCRYVPRGFLFEKSGSAVVAERIDSVDLLGQLNSKGAMYFLQLLNPTIHFQTGDLTRTPVSSTDSERHDRQSKDGRRAGVLITLSKADWDARETSWEFLRAPLLTLYPAQPLERTVDESVKDISWPSASGTARPLSEAYSSYTAHWTEQFKEMHLLEEENNRIFIDLYGLHDELSPEVPYSEVTILQDELDKDARERGEIVFNKKEVLRQFVSYGVGCIFGRYSLDEDGLMLANAGDTIDTYLERIPNPRLRPDESGILPITEDDDFPDDLPSQFRAFLRAAFGTEQYDDNLQFLEEGLGRDLRSYFLKEFYKDHVKRYKKRPIYWLITSSKGSLRALIYLHRYNRDTVNRFLNDYLRPYQRKLEARRRTAEQSLNTAGLSGSERTKARKDIDRISAALDELSVWERDVVRPLAEQRVELDLDDGVKVNYGKLGAILETVKGLNG